MTRSPFPLWVHNGGASGCHAGLLHRRLRATVSPAHPLEESPVSEWWGGAAWQHPDSWQLTGGHRPTGLSLPRGRGRPSGQNQCRRPHLIKGGHGPAGGASSMCQPKPRHRPAGGAIVHMRKLKCRHAASAELGSGQSWGWLWSQALPSHLKVPSNKLRRPSIQGQEAASLPPEPPAVVAPPGAGENSHSEMPHPSRARPTPKRQSIGKESSLNVRGTDTCPYGHLGNRVLWK